jgi:hypothetical protein
MNESVENIENFIHKVIEDAEGSEFKPSIFHNKHGQAYEFYIKPDAYYGRWIAPGITLYYSIEDESLVGGFIEYNFAEK